MGVSSLIAAALKLLAPLLYDGERGGWALAWGAGVLLLAAQAASLPPALRAASADPISALRAD